MEFVDPLKVIPYKIRFGCILRVDKLDEEMLRWMKRSGCWNIYIGVETANERLLKLMNKNISLRLVKEKIQLIHKYQINVYGSFIIGLPTETKREVENTLRLSRSLRLDAASFFTYSASKNTPLYDLAVMNEKIDRNWTNYSRLSDTPAYVDRNLTSEFLARKQKEAYRKFYLTPSYMLTHLDAVLNFGLAKNPLRRFMKKIPSSNIARRT